jgi:hypothetical protein
LSDETRGVQPVAPKCRVPRNVAVDARFLWAAITSLRDTITDTLYKTTDATFAYDVVTARTVGQTQLEYVDVCRLDQIAVTNYA